MESSLERNVTRDEFNGLGIKVSELRESCIGCRTRMESEIMHLNEEQKELKKDVIELKACIKDLSDKVQAFTIKMSLEVQALTIKLSIAIAVVVVVLNFIIPVALKKIGA